MGLIKKYKTGNTMNLSFNNNDYLQRKNLIAKADKNAAGVNSNAIMDKSIKDANTMFSFTPKDYSSIQENKNQEAKNNTIKSTAVSAGVDKGLSYLSYGSGLAANNAAFSYNKGMNAAGANFAMGDYSKMSENLDDASKAAKNAETMGKISKGVSGAATTVGAVGVIKGIAAPVKEAIDSKLDYNKYGEATNNAQAIGKDWRTSDSDRMMQTWGENKDKGFGTQLGRTLIESAGWGKIGRTVSNAFGKQGVNESNAKTGADKFFAATNRMTGVSRNREKIDEQIAAIDKENAEEEARLKKDKDIYLKRARDQQSSANLYNSNNSGIYKKGGKLIPRFRRGGELDLEKENVILDGPSHDDHNKTGVKGDKGLPVVNKGTKVAEIESLELILNKNSSVKLENLAKEYKKTGDAKILNKIGEVMKKEINDNTYDYSKEIL